MTAAKHAESFPRLAKYELLEEIGHGGMATVYRARDVRLGREVAVKVIHRHLRESVEVATRFVAEARAVAKLRHPNIVEVFDVSDEGDDERFLVVELLRGTTLRKLLAAHREMPPEIGAAIALEIAAALSHAHSAGVIHRDVKPENVLVETGAEAGASGGVVVKLTDFGIAKVLDAQGVTSTGQVLGSPAHMAPEQIEGGDVDVRADVFGLGVLLYEAMVGHLPFEGKNPAQVLRRVLDGLYSPAERERGTVGARWSKLLDRALAKEAADRFPSIDAFAEAMKLELDALGIASPKDELRDYFADPDGYRERHVARLVATLAKRGEASRRNGDRIGAAADFNRALAYAPNDPAVVRQVARVGRGRARRRVLAYVSAIVGGSMLLGFVAYRVARALRPPPPPVVASVDAPVRAIAAPNPTPVAVAAVPAASASAQHPVLARPTAVVAPVTGAALSIPLDASKPRADEGSREVRITINPHSALVSIDGAPAEQIFGTAPRSMTVGTHAWRASVANSNCCEETAGSFEVRAGDGVQLVGLSVPFKDARLTGQGAPEGATLRCNVLKGSGPASGTYAVKMSALDLGGVCWIDAPGLPTQQSSITLRAGETYTVPWR